MLIIKNSVEQLSIRFVPHCQLKIGLPDCFIHGPEEHKRLHRLETVATMQRKFEPMYGPAGKVIIPR